jgi:predicted nucleic acid-binding protein
VSNSYCLDACALITFIDNEIGADIVENIIDMAVSGDAKIYMSAVNLAEVIYIFRKVMTDEQMAELWQDIQELPITVIREITDSIISEAANLKFRNHMSHADSLGLATSKDIGAAFITSDHSELDPVSQHEKISFLWLPAKPKKQ